MMQKLKKEQHILKQIQKMKLPTVREVRKSKSAIKGTAKQYTIDGVVGYDAESFLDEVQPQIADLLVKNRQVTVYFVLSCNMERVDMKTGQVITVEAPFSSKNAINLDSADVNILYSNAVKKIKESMSTYQEQGSNWRFKSVVHLDINIMAYKPLTGRSYIPLPAFLAHKKAIVNIKN